jgi:hypothetical protein
MPVKGGASFTWSVNAQLGTYCSDKGTLSRSDRRMMMMLTAIVGRSLLRDLHPDDAVGGQLERLRFLDQGAGRAGYVRARQHTGG